MVWIERGLFAIVGAVGATAVFLYLGKITATGDFVANVTGAAIGAGASVALAIWTFHRERRIAAADAAVAAAEARELAIREALRHVRSIRDCIADAQAITINSQGRTVLNINKAASLARSALADPNLTDFALRMAMEDAAAIAAHASPALDQAVRSANLQDANIPAPDAQKICDDAVAEINLLIARYTQKRTLPAI